MRARRFDLFHLTIRDIITFRAYQRGWKDGRESVCFTYSDSMKFTTVRKRNTQMFDVLYNIYHEANPNLPYEASERVITDYLYDAIIVEMRPPKDSPTTICLTNDMKYVSAKRTADLPSFLYRNGFTIKGVPQEKCNQVLQKENEEKGQKESGDCGGQTNSKTVDLEYVPFIASASMARQSEYLFVRKDVAPKLMRRLSLDILDMDENGLPFAGGMEKKEKQIQTDGADREKPDKAVGVLKGKKEDGRPYRFLAPSKISAYIGNALSDGSSVEEMQSAWESTHKSESPAPSVDLNANTVICVKDIKDFSMNADASSFYVWKMREFDQPRPELKGVYSGKRRGAGEQDTGLIQLFSLLSAAKSVAKTMKEQINSDVMEQWKRQIDQIQQSDLEKWMDGRVAPLCMPLSTQQIGLRIKQLAFLIALRLELMDQSETEKTIKNDELTGLKDTLKARINSLFPKQENTDGGKGKDEYQPFRDLLKWIRMPDKEGAAFTAWKISRQGNAARIEFQTSRNHILLEPLRRSNEEINLQETPLGRFCGMIALFADPKKKKEDFSNYLTDYREDLKNAWLQALSEVEQPPLGLEKLRLPGSTDLTAIAKSVQGYAFLYAAALHLKQKTEEINDRRTLYFRINWNVETEDGAGPDEMDMPEKGSEARPYTLQELCAELSSSVETMLDGPMNDGERGKFAAGLWNSVRGTEDRSGQPELISCGVVNRDEEEESKKAPTRALLQVSLMNNSFTPFRAELTPNMPNELIELFGYLGKTDEAAKENAKQLIGDCQPALKRQMSQWLNWEDQSKTAVGVLHSCCSRLTELGVCPLGEQSEWDAETIWEKTRGCSQVFGKAGEIDKNNKDELFENSGNLYDGVGFADDDVFDALEKLITGKEELETPRLYNGFIIRLPWVKGLLIRLNWKEILLQKAGLESGQDVMIEDIFGKERPLADAHVLLTESMFKGYKQLSQLNLDNEKVKAAFNEGEAIDSWAYFWKKIAEYKISLLIAGRNSRPSPVTRMNYQFLATNVLSADKIRDMAESVLKKAVGRYKDPIEFIREYVDKPDDHPAEISNSEENVDNVFQAEVQNEGKNAENAEGTEISGDDDLLTLGELSEIGMDLVESGSGSINENEIQQKLLELLPEFACTNYMKKAMDSRMRSIVMQMMRGQIPEIKGDVRFLVPDLDAMLEWISRLIKGAEKSGNKRVYSPINACGKRGMGHYYAPAPEEHNSTWYKMSKTGEIVEGRDAVILRNPHLAAGEDALLMPLDGWNLLDYEKNYGHLDGLVMIPSIAFATINGADSDGDRASVVTQQEIVEAVRKSVAKTNEVIDQAIKEKQELIKYLKDEEERLRYHRPDPEETSANPEKQAVRNAPMYDHMLPKYIDSLMWLIESLPDHANSHNPDVCPPLIYSGSNAKGNLLSPEELTAGSETLKNAFWKAYTLTTEQAIGVMSLNALDNAAAAYKESLSDGIIDKAGLKKEQKTDEPLKPNGRIILDLLRFWRVINGALQTALEIDMAKTSVRPYAHPLQESLKNTDGKFFGESYESGTSVFRKYRNLFVAKRAELVQMSDYQFTQDMEQIIKEVYGKWTVKECHPVELIPKIVWACWMEQKENLPLSDKSKSFGSLFGWMELKKEWTALQNDAENKSAAEAAEKTLKTMEKSIVDYGKTIDARKKLAARRGLLASSYRSCMKYLLREYPMLDAMSKIKELLPGEGESELRRLFDAEMLKKQHTSPLKMVCVKDIGKRNEQYRSLLKSSDNKLRGEKTLAQFVWEEDAGKRMEQYESLLNIQLDDGMLSGIVRRHASDIYFMKQLIKYLCKEEEIRAGYIAGAEGIHTPAALRRKLLSETNGYSESESKRFLLIKCFQLLNAYGGYIIDEDGARIKVMSEFLMIHLLGDYLVEIAGQKKPADNGLKKNGLKKISSDTEEEIAECSDSMKQPK